jgi:hypothetical protein
MIYRNADTPTAVYKYLTPDRAKSILNKLLLRFSQASSLNDALEFKPALKGMGIRKEIEKAIRERLEMKYPGIFSRIQASHSPDVASKHIDEIISAGVDAVESDANYQRSVKEVYRSLDENFGVLSLSETPTSPLMWSHYADGGRGFLIEFDGQNNWFWAQREERDSFRHLRQVKYIERVPEYFLNLPEEVTLYTKSIEWGYEKEWRIIRNFNEAATKNGIDAYGKDVLLFAVPVLKV